ncbi:hypothetical protein L6164_001332 [Bauhinia variegata]|uniref:Uncharacterized protein n=1 Tax=Bauhinia variegata TaxID=167791 RepID=A0ACB9QFZ6_BAUVA|nr:hypothetical protein L6164_001332 [Bauhinia variegata]
MARLHYARRKRLIGILIMHLELLNQFTLFLMNMYLILLVDRLRRTRRRVTWDYESRAMVRDVNFQRIVYTSDSACIKNTRMDRRCFHQLCELVKTVGMLLPTKHMGVEEQVAIFLHILSHDVKNRVIKRQFMRSGETISRQFNKVLQAILKCHSVLLKQPEPVLENSIDESWKWFKNCLGALGGTHIQLNVLQADKARYQTMKGEIATNVLGVCSQDLQFIYVLAGWEGSAANSKVLKDAISRRNGLKVPKGCYYLCDASYKNREGFLTPYRGQRYHPSEWRQGAPPTTPQEFFNMKHYFARNVIEKCFVLLKGRWEILRVKSSYSVKTKCRISTACCLLHNHIRREMVIDPLEHNLMEIGENGDALQGDTITQLEKLDAWTKWRDELAQEMFNKWRKIN